MIFQDVLILSDDKGLRSEPQLRWQSPVCRERWMKCFRYFCVRSSLPPPTLQLQQLPAGGAHTGLLMPRLGLN